MPLTLSSAATFRATIKASYLASFLVDALNSQCIAWAIMSPCHDFSTNPSLAPFVLLRLYIGSILELMSALVVATVLRQPQFVDLD